MQPDILILGQGLAGTWLAWELERAGIPFAMLDAGDATAASRVGAGIINPITGRRLVKSWRVETLLPAARAAYRELEAALGLTVWHDMRVRREFADEIERRTFQQKQARAELAPFAGGADDAGFWIEGAAWVECGALLDATRARWRAQGRLTTAASDVVADPGRHDLVVDCTGLAGARATLFNFVPWEFSKGEMLEIAIAGLASDTVLNRRHWVLPVGPTAAWVGATHEPGVCDPTISLAARTVLEASAQGLLGRPFRVTGQRAGIRVNLPDRLPVAGRHPDSPRCGVINGLGAKGALLAPMLARQWVNHLTEGVPLDLAVDVARFRRGVSGVRGSSQAEVSRGAPGEQNGRPG